MFTYYLFTKKKNSLSLSVKDVSTDMCGRGVAHSQLPDQPRLQQHHRRASSLPRQSPQADNSTTARTTDAATGTIDDGTNADVQRSVDS